MSLGYFPRIETIVVPSEVRDDCIGKYVSERVSFILTDLGSLTYNPKSIFIKPVNERFFILCFEATGTYTVPRSLNIYKEKPVEKVVEVQRPDPEEQKPVEQDEVALRDKGRPSAFFRTMGKS